MERKFEEPLAQTYSRKKEKLLSKDRTQTTENKGSREKGTGEERRRETRRIKKRQKRLSSFDENLHKERDQKRMGNFKKPRGIIITKKKNESLEIGRNFFEYSLMMFYLWRAKKLFFFKKEKLKLLGKTN